MLWWYAGLILGLRSANERRRYKLTLSLIAGRKPKISPGMHKIQTGKGRCLREIVPKYYCDLFFHRRSLVVLFLIDLWEKFHYPVRYEGSLINQVSKSIYEILPVKWTECTYLIRLNG